MQILSSPTNKQVAGPSTTPDDEQGGSRSASSAANQQTPEMRFEHEGVVKDGQDDEALDAAVTATVFAKTPNTEQTERESRQEAHVLME